jgi:hypothetical protein
MERTVPVKKIVAFLLMLAIVGSLSMATTGCGKKAEDKKTAAEKKDEKKDDKKP